jgi:EAL domain-containing protein (putative c-di-GMP-specific phosphodiesterase class I)
VTETALLADFEVARDNLKALRAAGARIVLDDFGAGHASISYLREMQFDGVKLDGQLIVTAADSLRGRRLLKGVLDLCAAMGLPSVAEHIETEDQLQLLRELGCREGQGYLLSPPLHAEAAAALAAPKVVDLDGRVAA